MTITDTAAQASIGAAARELRLPTVGGEATRLADIAAREHQSYLAFLAEILAAEVDDRTDRRRARRIAEARFPRLKRLSEFNADAAPTIQPAQLAALASGAYLAAGDPVVLLGDSGTGKTHLLIALGLAACEQGRRVRYVTTAALVNELAEAAGDRALSRVVARYGRLDLLLLDELGYVKVDPRTTSCPVCATPFTPVRRQRYCSPACRQTALGRRQPAPSRCRHHLARPAARPASTSAANATSATRPASGATTATGPAGSSATAAHAHAATSPSPPANYSASKPGAKIHDHSGAKTLDDTHTPRQRSAHAQ